MSAFVKASSDALRLVPAVNAVIEGDELVYRDYTDISIAVATPKGLVVPVLRNVDALNFAGIEKVWLACGQTTKLRSPVKSCLVRTGHAGERMLLRQSKALMCQHEWCTHKTQGKVHFTQSTAAVQAEDRVQAINALGKKARDGTISIDDMAGGTFTISNGGVYGSLLSTPIINPPQSAIMGMHSINQRAMVVNGEIMARPIMNVALTYDHRLIDGREAVTFLKRVKDIVEDPRRLLLAV